ncbi:MAG: hypothetical protein K2M36_06010 [Clostridia bacterium]|nr:hypothetical protein [Clostridia bacterium]
MQIYKDMAGLVKSLLHSPRHDKLESDMVEAMHTVEECRQGGADESYLIIADTQEEEQSAMEEYGLLDCFPETDAEIVAGRERWRKRVFVTDDEGNGVVLYSVPDDEKRTQ